MNDLKVFENQTFGAVRAMVRNGEPWFVAADVCKALDIGNPTQALDRLDDDEKSITLISNEGNRGNPNVAIVSEPGLYTLVLGSRKPEARAFKRWVTHDVIPSIRRTGMYATEDLLANPDLAIAAFTQLRDERARRIALEAEVKANSSRVLFAQSVEASSQSILVGELAKLMRQNGVEIGQNRLFERLRADGFLCSVGSQRNMPTQRSMEMGLMEIKERSIANPDGTVRLTLTPKILGRGQVYFINRYRNGPA